jgi:putative ABC transport system ATP-binding protein
MTESASLAVCCRNVEKSFGAGEARARVLRGVDLDVRAGEMTFLVGPSGCGKTTLISAIAGMLGVDDGRIEVFGREVTRLGGRALTLFRAAEVGFIFQQFNLLPTLTAAENAAVPLLVRGEGARAAERAAAALLGRLGLEAHTQKYPSELSGGQQQRVAIARALIHAPRLIVCDEPTASLDAAMGHAVMRLLRDAAMRPGRAVIVVTHDERIFPFADRIARMADGRIESVQDTPAASEAA